MFAIFLSEAVGSMLLILLGCGVVANTALTKSKGKGGLVRIDGCNS